jgi:hypothetical protein
MASYLLLEDGSKIILEDASGFILLEEGDPVFPAGGDVKHFPYGQGVTMKHIVHPYHVFTTRY